MLLRLRLRFGLIWLEFLCWLDGFDGVVVMGWFVVDYWLRYFLYVDVNVDGDGDYVYK